MTSPKKPSSGISRLYNGHYKNDLQEMSSYNKPYKNEQEMTKPYKPGSSGSSSSSSSSSAIPATSLSIPQMSSPSSSPHLVRTPSPRKPPPINTNVHGESPYGSPSSITSNRRTLSEKIKATPASYVRHSRVYSSSDLSFLDHHNLGGTPSGLGRSSSLMQLQNKLLSETLAPEVAPVVNLINAQKMRTYATGQFQLPGVIGGGERVWIEVEAKICGTELAIWRPSNDDYSVEGNDEFTPKYINLADAKIEHNGGREVRILSDWQLGNATVVKFHSASDLEYWLAAMYLSKYEHNSLNEAYTAVVLSTKLRNLADVHLLLSRKRFAHSEWCNLRLPQISPRWIKVFMVVSAPESKKLGSISIYTSEKLSKKNLIVHVANVVDAYNVYPEHPEMIDFNSIMKMSGDIYVSRAHEYLFASDDKKNQKVRRSSSYFESAPPLENTPRSRSNSESKRSFLGLGSRSRSNSASTKQPNASSRSNSDPRLDEELLRNTAHFVKKNKKDFVSASYLYVMPVAHPGVPPVETMIRNFMHIIDVFQLYGRPDHFVSDKTDQRSMLFGLPSLPHYQYLTMEDARNVAAQHLASDLNEHEWMAAFKNGVAAKFSGPTRTYKGAGDITRLYGAVECEISSPTVSIRSPQLPDVPERLLGFTDGTDLGSLEDGLGAPISLDKLGVSGLVMREKGEVFA